MAAVTTTGSLGAQIEAMVQQYQSSLVSQKVTPMNNRKTTLNARLIALANIKGKLQTLYDTSNGLVQSGVSSPFAVLSATSSLPGVITATASSGALLGSHTLFVTQLAKSDVALSSQLTSASTSVATALGAGVKTIQVGNQSVDVTIAGGDSNGTILTNTARAINAKGGDVTASVVTDTSTTSRLVLTSSSSGSTNAMVLSDTAGSLLSAIGLTAGVISGRTASTATDGGFMVSDTTLLDAKFKLDGIDIVRYSNTVSDVLTNVSFQLSAAQALSDTPATLTIGLNQAQVTTNVQKFLTDYNSALSYLKAETATDPKNSIRQILAGDSTFTLLKLNLQMLPMGVVSTVQSGNPDVLFKIGITAAVNGSLSISDASKFNAALTADPAKVADLFNSSNGMAVQMKNMLSGFVTTQGRLDKMTGSVTNQVTSLTNSIKTMNDRIKAQVQRYRDDFVKLQSAYQIATQQQQLMSTILSSSLYSTTG